MNTLKKLSIILVFLTFFTLPALGGDTSSKEGRRGHRCPPPEAYTACEGRSAGDEAEFVSPHGDTVTGTCEEDCCGRLILHPDHPPRREPDSKKTEDIDS